MGVVDRDRGYRRLMKAVRKPPREMTVGIHADAGEAVEVASYHEFGTETIPRRSFIADWVDENEAKHRASLKLMATSVLKGRHTVNSALDTLGLRFVGEIQGRIAAGIDPPNAPATVAAKGSSTPLVNTGTLKASVAHKVE